MICGYSVWKLERVAFFNSSTCSVQHAQLWIALALYRGQKQRGRGGMLNIGEIDSNLHLTDEGVVDATACGSCCEKERAGAMPPISADIYPI